MPESFRKTVVIVACSSLMLLNACRAKTETATENTMVTDMNVVEADEAMADNMTAVDGFSNDSMMSNDTMMMSNDAAATDGDQPGETPPAPATRPPMATPAPETLAWCAVLNDRVAVAECSEASEFARNLGVGDAGMNAPEAMDLGEVREVSLAVVPQPTQTGQPNPTSLEDVLGSKPSSSGAIRTSRRMAAVLEGDGFQIAPAGRQQKDLGLQGGAVWRWNVTALPASTHELHLSVYAVMLDKSGKPTDTLIRVLHSSVKVKTGWLPRLTQAVSDATGLTSGVAKFLTALAALIGAAGAVWAAWRAFGKGKDGPAK